MDELIIYENFTNFSEYDNESSLNKWGPKHGSLYIVVPMTIIYVIVFMSGLIGNISTCIVISKNKTMHTATNYYLFSLAISDLLLLVSGLPPEIYLIWCRYPYIFGYTFCILRGLFAETSANATVLTITAFTIERYVAICHPFLSHTMSKLSRVVKLILVIWFVAICCAIPQALQFGTIELLEGDPDSVMCYVINPILRYSFEISTIIFFVLPMTLITVLYAMIGFRLRSSNMMKNSGEFARNVSSGSKKNPMVRKNSNKLNQLQSSRRVLKMLVAVVLAFFICWAPFHVQRLVATYVELNEIDISEHPKYLKIYEVVTYISGILYFVSTTINPVLYNIMSNKFREAFKETFTRCCVCCHGVNAGRPERTYSVLSRSRQRIIESSDSGRDDHSLHTHSTLTNKTSIDTVSTSEFTKPSPTIRKSSRNKKHEKQLIHNKSSKRDRGADVSIRLVSKTNLDKITANTRLVVMHIPAAAPRPPNSITKLRRYFHCLQNDHHFKQNDRRNESICSYSSTSPAKDSLHSLQLHKTPDKLAKANSDISNSSLKDVEPGALEDELTLYMHEIRLREENN